MLAYLFNGDGLWPKTADLCSRGRNALLDMELGPGASYELGLWGPAWDAPVYSVAVTNSFEHGEVTGSRFLAAWPLVADGQTEWLRQASELALVAKSLLSRSQPGGPRANHGFSSRSWRRLRMLARETGLGRFRVYLCRMPPALLAYSGLSEFGRAFRAAGHCGGKKGVRAWDQSALAVALEWGRRLTGALAHRLLRSPIASRAAGLPIRSGLARQATFVQRLLRADRSAFRLAQTWTRSMEVRARAAGLLFQSREYRAFRREHLTVCIPSVGCGLGLDAAEAVADQARRAGKLRLFQAAVKAVRRLRFILFGVREGLGAEERRSLVGERQAYVALRSRVEAARRRLGNLARRWFAQTGSRVLSRFLGKVGDLLLSSSFYFQTEHLEQTRSGFTHAALLERLGQVAGIGSVPWQLDRVLGYFYWYPVSRLAHSVSVELLEPAPRLARRKRLYQWVQLAVPRTFRFRSGAVSSKVTLLNLLTLLRRRMRHCPRYYTLPGFFYSAASWMMANSHNAALLEKAWEERSYRGGRYRSLSQAGLNRLKGKTLLIPVGLVP